MTEDLAALASFPGTVRLFPLPNLVLFPQVVQGLHIFEPRYRQLMADAVSTDMLITLALLKPGWEDDYDNAPPIFDVACLGRVMQYEKLPDGRYNLRLKGISRVRLTDEIPTDKLYRVARADLIVEEPPACGMSDLRHKLAEAVLPRFPADGSAHQQLRDLFDGDTPLGHLCDLLGYALPLPLDVKHQLLAEPSAAQRAEVITAALRLRAAAADRKFPPEFSVN
jgi:Lon protease-like protein